jgi:hypothetical protein
MRSLLDHPSLRTIIALAMASLLVLAVAGCGGDDDDNPAAPGGGSGNTDVFDQATAIAQSQAAGSQAASLVQSMSAMAAGVGKSADKVEEYGWNSETERWEWTYEWSGEGYTYDYFYTVQYRDADGEPQESASGASSLVHTLDGESTSSYEGEGTVSNQAWSYRYNTTVAGLDGDTHTMTGDGGYDMDVTGSAAGMDFSYSYEVSWATQGDGITRSAAGGCPTGTIRYDFPPYYSLVVFDGSDVATSTLYDANSTAVTGGQSTHQLFCGTVRVGD